MSYFAANSDADAIAATLPAALIPAYLAITDDAVKTAVLQQAGDDINQAMRYQGRRYDTVSQVDEFPRVAYEPSNAVLPNSGAVGIPGGSAFGSTVWDIDPVSLLVVVPQRVLVAVIYQANYLQGGEDPIIDSQYKGIKSEKIGTAQTEYDPKNPAVETSLCRRAHQLMKRYRLKSGRMY